MKPLVFLMGSRVLLFLALSQPEEKASRPWDPNKRGDDALADHIPRYSNIIHDYTYQPTINVINHPNPKHPEKNQTKSHRGRCL